jgi:hypothetical protein
MMIVKFCSGVGNQMYQYAVYLALKKRYPYTRICADLTAFEDDKILNQGNGFSYGFALENFFGVRVDKATRKEVSDVNYEMYFGPGIRKLFPRFAAKHAGASRLAKLRAMISPKHRKLLSRYIANNPSNAYTGDLWNLNETEDYYLGGLWQNMSFLRDVSADLRSQFQIQLNLIEYLSDIQKRILESDSVCIHVRRGDFTHAKNQYRYNLCNMDYYRKAIELIKSKMTSPSFFVFSDDIEYCKRIFQDIVDLDYVYDKDASSAAVDMLLISQCKAAIISNSTFAFWSVYVSDTGKKTVICPRYSLRSPACWSEFSVPEHWIKIDNL